MVPIRSLSDHDISSFDKYVLKLKGPSCDAVGSGTPYTPLNTDPIYLRTFCQFSIIQLTTCLLKYRLGLYGSWSSPSTAPPTPLWRTCRLFLITKNRQFPLPSTLKQSKIKTLFSTKWSLKEPFGHNQVAT